MKIVMTYNYARDYVDDVFICDDVLICENVSRTYGTIIVDYLNKPINRGNDKHFKLVNDDYKLVEFEV